MNKIYKIIILVLTFCLVFTGGVVTAISLNAKEIKFTSINENWNVDNVEDAMNDLYVKSSEAGNANLVDLGKGTSFDLTSYVGYENFTNDNFIVVSIDELSKTGSSSYQPGLSANVPSQASANYSTIKEYNSESGLLTAYVKFSGASHRNGGAMAGSLPSFSSTEEVQVYLVY